jgi:hypothetical protein
MDLFITTERGKLVQNGEILDSPELFIPSKKYEDGKLTTLASINNIHSVCESLLELFIRPMGMKLNHDRDYTYYKMDVVKKYTDGTYPPKRSEGNLTRGWCAITSGVLHRFFWKNYDLYRAKCPLTPVGEKQDYHYWLESKCRNYVIDICEEQYLKVGVKNIRENGEFMHGLVSASIKKKARNMAFIIATYRFPDAVNFDELEVYSYKK